MSDKKRKGLWLALDLLLAGALIFLDQFTKKLAVEKLQGQKPFVILKGIFELDYLENRGSAFGMFQNQKIFLLCTGVIFLGVMLYLLIRTPAQKRYLAIHLAGAGIAAGGFGNIIDRFRLGYVVDFFSFVLIHFPVFNMADIYIVIFTILMAILLIFIYKDEELDFLFPNKKAARNKKED